MILASRHRKESSFKILRTKCRLCDDSVMSSCCDIKRDAYLDTFTHTNVFWEDLFFISAASSLVFFDGDCLSFESSDDWS